MKKLLIILCVLLAVLAIYGGYRLFTFNLFDVEFLELETIEVPNKDYVLKAYFIPSNATSQAFIQIRKVEAGVEEVIANYQRYNRLDGYFYQDDTISFILNDSSLVKSKADTIVFNLP